MKSFKKITALIMAIVMIFSFSLFQSYAVTSIGDFKNYYETLDNTLISLTPGKDATELNFAWHSEWSLKKPVVRISKNADMTNFAEFTGSYSFSENSEQRVNRVTATVIEENTTYYYVYGVDGIFSAPNEYKTYKTDSFKFLYISDVQLNYKSPLYFRSHSWNTLLENAFAVNDDISFIVNGGDLTNNGKNTDEWIGTLSPKTLRSVPMATVVGNHDDRGFASTYPHYVNNPNIYRGATPSISGNGYWFRYGDVLFVMINSNKINIFDNKNLIEKAVEENPDAKWRIAVMHHDVYGTDRHVIESETVAVRNSLCPVFDKYDFDVVLTGHDHMYGRSYLIKNNEMVIDDNYRTGTVTDPEGTLYITASSAGASSGKADAIPEDYWWIAKMNLNGRDSYTTFEIDSNNLNMITCDAQTNEVIDTFNIVKTNTEFETEETTGGYIGSMLKPLMKDYFIIFEIIFDLFERFVGSFTK